MLESIHPEQAITLATHLNPLSGLSNRSFENIKLVKTSETTTDVETKHQVPTETTDSAKEIEIYPRTYSNEKFDPHDLRKSWEFITIPPLGQGETVIKHEVPRNLIEEADLNSGEVYKVALSDKCLGTRWWTFGKLDDLGEKARLMLWDEDCDEDEESFRRIRGEKPEDLELVKEGSVEFEVV